MYGFYQVPHSNSESGIVASTVSDQASLFSFQVRSASTSGSSRNQSSVQISDIFGSIKVIDKKTALAASYLSFFIL
jgi:hypothetical protein